MPSKIISLNNIHPLSTDAVMKKVERFIKSLNIKNRKVLFICEDITRSTPINLFFPRLLQYVHTQTNDIAVLFALGTHRSMTMEEMIEKLGISRRQTQYIQLINHDALDDKQLVAVGKVCNVIFKVNSAIADADIVIGISNSLPHKVMGFSGGPKLICIGTGNKDFIDYSHWLSNSISESRVVAQVNNPMRDLLNRVFKMLQDEVKADFFSINFVSAQEKILAAYMGDFFRVYQAAAKKSRQLFIKKIVPRNSVLAILDDKSLDFWQASKAVYNCVGAIGKGGFIVVRGLLPDKISPVHGKIIEKYGYQKRAKLRKLIAEGKLNDVVVASHMMRVGKCLERIKVFISSENIDADLCRRVNFSYIDPLKIRNMKFDYIVHNPVDITLINKYGD
ncbi:MAG: hypothetical protein A2729_01390 [Candidatus Buchananbacteria bacterium RIFCSPHIGHO2_01_FULL_39_14]|uniref:LarA-like N-terminal domain-containing protein n=2 Tax=Candidatus Buchananiibacteriota TaxID=1817903 RepID=A0A1G1YSU3_9BACT|nr:MAG: hypothetical protein A2729_01390 [Candidatus Buchananbacteria bacterium RIFCSPHIGHO2_01_FULL_39_14]OGY49218.1 MAG: hypothetical protein A3D39_00415 [Candidatus Buchananbacteria bacterium RIFCSPHIGHO2_02_FULL_39_17]OGY55423.1 MAG: hypothetical protein A2912_00780 [Candidatus Buchananbacteria bacterium RIFCSPLOWO2_01_FULL_40_23b]